MVKNRLYGHWFECIPYDFLKWDMGNRYRDRFIRSYRLYGQFFASPDSDHISYIYCSSYMMHYAANKLYCPAACLAL